MEENFTDRQNAIAAIALGMDTRELERTIELLQQHIELREVDECKEKFYNFIAEMNEIKGYQGCYLFIPDEAIAEMPSSREEVNREKGRYFLLDSSNFEVTTDNEGDTIIRVVPMSENYKEE